MHLACCLFSNQVFRSTASIISPTLTLHWSGSCNSNFAIQFFQSITVHGQTFVKYLCSRHPCEALGIQVPSTKNHLYSKRASILMEKTASTYISIYRIIRSEYIQRNRKRFSMGDLERRVQPAAARAPSAYLGFGHCPAELFHPFVSSNPDL